MIDYARVQGDFINRNTSSPIIRKSLSAVREAAKNKFFFRGQFTKAFSPPPPPRLSGGTATNLKKKVVFSLVDNPPPLLLSGLSIKKRIAPT